VKASDHQFIALLFLDVTFEEGYSVEEESGDWVSRAYLYYNVKEW
jgi:hypothetical protein